MCERGKPVGLQEWIETTLGQKPAESAIDLIYRSTGKVKLSDIYLMYCGEYKGFRVWIWNGARTCSLLYPPWVMGGNHQRYRFNPRGELIIDSRNSIEEYFYTLEHEVVECRMMEELGCTYARAHTEGGLAVELKLRQEQYELMQEKELSMPPVVLGRWGKHLKSGGKDVTIDLRGVYRNYLGVFEGLPIYLMDGPAIRRQIEPDFTFSGHELEFDFIEGEGWLDATQPVADGFYSLIEMLSYRRHLMSGMSRSDAYDCALAVKEAEYQRQKALCREHERNLPPVRYGVRERGARRK